jgi:cobalt-zinc-cadmium resistance protein CzcA
MWCFLIMLIFFLVSFRAAVALLRSPFRSRSCLHSSCCMRRRSRQNLLSIGAIDFGIVIDGTVVMIENIYRELAAREGSNTT